MDAEVDYGEMEYGRVDDSEDGYFSYSDFGKEELELNMENARCEKSWEPSPPLLPSPFSAPSHSPPLSCSPLPIDFAWI